MKGMQLKEPLTMSVAEAARITGCSRGKIYKMIKSGAVCIIDLDGAIRIDRKAYMEQLKAGGFQRPTQDKTEGVLVAIKSHRGGRR